MQGLCCITKTTYSRLVHLSALDDKNWGKEEEPCPSSLNDRWPRRGTGLGMEGEIWIANDACEDKMK